MENIIWMERFCYSKLGTFGKLRMPSGWECYTVERPWMGNQVGISCIPEGAYHLGMRYSPVVERTTNGKYDEGWEVEDVVSRTYIMIHPGNWASSVKGCIAVGDDFKIVAGKLGVSNSQETYGLMREEMDQRNDWELIIRPLRIEYP